jgi:hypothetical protein
MQSTSRRGILNIGLVSGCAALIPSVSEAKRTTSDDDATADLRFRLAAGYKPDLSAKTERRMMQGVLDFLNKFHPPGMTMSIWDRNPRDIPYLEEHVAELIATVFAGVKDNLAVQPVDPLLIVSLLYNESRFSPLAMSPTGALGMAQFMPETALSYGLSPVARMATWENFRETQRRERAARAANQRAFLDRYGIASFSAATVISAALATKDLQVLAAYQELVDAERREQAVLEDYLNELRNDLERYDFFGDGRAALVSMDARIGYAAVAAAVVYIARRFAENSGMATSAIAAYNAGPASVLERNPRSVLYKYGNLPAYPETVLYLQRVMVVYTRLRDLIDR